PEDRKRAREAARQAGLEFVEAPIGSAADLPQAARRLAPPVPAPWMPADPLLAPPQGFPFPPALSPESRLPPPALPAPPVETGALVAVTPDYVQAGTLAAQQVRRIRLGERPADLPALAVTRTHTVVNLATARSLGAVGAVVARRDVEFVK